jgi:N-acetylglucosamine-6-phosphate deacetylase
MSGYVDVQINGYAGIDFNADDLQAEALHAACKALSRDGVEGVLATFITDDLDLMCSRIERFSRLREQDPLARERIWGFHVEGPFLNPARGYIGAHPTDQAQPATPDAMARLLEAGDGLVRLVTLAPEVDSGMKVTRLLARQGIIVSGGHSDASLDDLQRGLDAGLSMFTHLGNGCPAEMPRHDNIISRVLSLADRLWISFIADGAHIPFFVLRNYLKITGLERVVIVTDAIAAAGCGPGVFQLGQRMVSVGEDGVPRAPDDSHLIGSGTIMSRMAANLETDLGFMPDQVDQLTSRNPRLLLGLPVTVESA